MVQSISSPAMDQLCGRFACKNSQDFEVAPSYLYDVGADVAGIGAQVLPLALTWLINGDERSPSSPASPMKSSFFSSFAK